MYIFNKKHCFILHNYHNFYIDIFCLYKGILVIIINLSKTKNEDIAPFLFTYIIFKF